MRAEGVERIHIAVVIDPDQFARLYLAHHFRADDVEGNAFAGKGDGIADAAHDERTDTERVAAGDHAFRRHHDQRIGAFEQAQRVDKAIDDRGIAARRDEMDDDFGVGGRLEDRPALHQFFAEFARVRDIAVMRDREAAARKVGIERLHVAQTRAARGRITHVPGCHMARQFGYCFC